MLITPARSSDVLKWKMNSRDQTRLIITILNTRSCNSHNTSNLLEYIGERMMMAKIHDTEKKDTTEDLDFLQLALDNLKLGYKLNVEQLEKSSSGHFKKLDDILELKTLC